MVTEVGVEGCLASGGTDGVVVGKLSNGQPCEPVVVLRRHVGTQDLLNGAVSLFSLTVSLGVMGSGHVELGTEGSEQGLPEVRGDARVTV